MISSYSRGYSIYWRMVAILTGSIATGCQTATNAVLDYPNPPLVEVLSQELHATLDGGGRFQLPPPSLTEEDITPDRAGQLAERFVRTYATNLRYLEGRRGSEINVSELVVAERIYFVPTPFEVLPRHLHNGVRKIYGSYYLVQMVNSQDPEDVVISIAVAAKNSDLVIEGNQIILPVEHGNEFMVDAVPLGSGVTLPLTPERAAQIAAHVSGSRVVGVPELVWEGAPQAPFLALWKVPLEQPVSATGAESRIEQEVLNIYVGPRGEIKYPHPNQIASRSIRVPRPLEGVVGGRPQRDFETRTLATIDGRSTRFERVTIVSLAN